MLDLTSIDIIDNETIVVLLYGVSSDELISQYCSINKHLMDYGFSNHADVLEMLLVSYEADEIEQHELALEVDDVLREACRICLLECGVTYDDEITLSMLDTLLMTVVGFDTTEDPQAIIDLLEPAEDDLDGLLIYLAERTGYSYDDWSPLIETVEFGVLERMILTCNDELDEELEDADVMTVTLDSRKDKLQKSGLIKNILSDSLPVDVKISMECLFLNNTGHLESLPIEESVQHLWTFSCLSNESVESAERQVDEFIDALYLEPSDKVKAINIKHALRERFKPLF